MATGSFTDLGERRSLDLNFAGAYLSAYTATSGESGTPTESSAPRVALSMDAASTTSGVSTKKTNAAATFTFTGAVTVVGYGVHADAQAATGPFAYLDFADAPITLGTAGGTATLPSGSTLASSD